MTHQTSTRRNILTDASRRAQPSHPPDPPIRFDPTPMVVTALVFVLALLFICFFSAFARRLFSTVGSHSSRRPPPPPLPYHYRGRRASLHPAAAGLDPAAVRALPVLTYAGGQAKEPLQCGVCLSELEVRGRVKVIPSCGHAFHPECIDAWLLGRGSCPLCRCTEMTGLRLAGEFCAVDVEEGVVGEEAGAGNGERVGLGRSRSFGCGEGGGERRVSSLRRSWSASEMIVMKS